MTATTRREFAKRLGLSGAALPFVWGLPGLASPAAAARPKQRLVVVFSPNGTVPSQFWPDADDGPLQLKRILEPLAPLKERTLVLKGVSNKVRGDGDNHMRGMGCLLTGIELFPGNIQGGSHTPAGWARGLSIDQEIRNFLQRDEATRTRFGSLEMGIAVPERADPWTRMSYAGPNQPVGPVSNPYQVFERLYGRAKDRESVRSVLDGVAAELNAAAAALGDEDRRQIERHMAFVRDMEAEMSRPDDAGLRHPMPPLEEGVAVDNDTIPKLGRMQTELLVNAFANDLARVATLQYTNSVGQARMTWLGIPEGHHSLSHDPDGNAESQEKLTRINAWFCGEIAHLAGRLAETPEPGGDGTLLDHTLIVWINELAKGNSHSLDNLPFVLVGAAPGFRMGRVAKFDKAAHNRLWMTVARSFGHDLPAFGNPAFCDGGALALG
ncbi:MAG: DUF1552 domain-containing protein [Lentisphaerae bacterium]|nr:DUF1552 domain-containing protein [Lentisphaerota bacterium]